MPTALATTASDPRAQTTRTVYRLLQMRGLSPDEAASLTAFIVGLPTNDLHWSLRQLNQLLFLRRLRETGAFEGAGGRTSRPD